MHQRHYKKCYSLVLTSFAQRLITIQYELSGLARIFHTKSITACGKLIITALVSNCDLGGMYAYSPASQFFTRLVLTSFAQRLITIQYELSGLVENCFCKLEDIDRDVSS